MLQMVDDLVRIYSLLCFSALELGKISVLFNLALSLFIMQEGCIQVLSGSFGQQFLIFLFTFFSFNLNLTEIMASGVMNFKEIKILI